MREIIRPIHSGFESLRIRRASADREAGFNRRAFPANEQMTAQGLSFRSRPLPFFGQGYSR